MPQISAESVSFE